MSHDEPTMAYVVSAAPRVGSGLLCDALSGVPGAGSPAEWFGRPMIHKLSGDWEMQAPGSTTDFPALANTTRYVERVRREAAGNGALSLKLHWNQIRWCRDHMAMDPLEVMDGFGDVRYIRIFREDLVAQAVSSWIASITKVYYRRDGQEARPSEEFEEAETSEPWYDFASLLGVLTELASIERGWVQYFGNRVIIPYEVSYERLIQDLSGTVNGALSHLGLPASDLITSNQVKQGGDLNREFAGQFRKDLAETSVLARLSPGIRRRCLAGDDDAA
jgi:trehalose 2-sulfotransferase